MLKLLEAIRQENKREREEIKSRLARIEAMVGQVLASGAASGMATPTNRRAKWQYAFHLISWSNRKEKTFPNLVMHPGNSVTGLLYNFEF